MSAFPPRVLERILDFAILDVNKYTYLWGEDGYRSQNNPLRLRLVSKAWQKVLKNILFLRLEFWHKKPDEDVDTGLDRLDVYVRHQTSDLCFEYHSRPSEERLGLVVGDFSNSTLKSWVREISLEGLHPYDLPAFSRNRFGVLDEIFQVFGEQEIRFSGFDCTWWQPQDGRSPLTSFTVKNVGDKTVGDLFPKLVVDRISLEKWNIGLDVNGAYDLAVLNEPNLLFQFLASDHLTQISVTTENLFQLCASASSHWCPSVTMLSIKHSIAFENRLSISMASIDELFPNLEWIDIACEHSDYQAPHSGHRSRPEGDPLKNLKHLGLRLAYPSDEIRHRGSYIDDIVRLASKSVTSLNLSFPWILKLQMALLVEEIPDFERLDDLKLFAFTDGRADEDELEPGSLALSAIPNLLEKIKPNEKMKTADIHLLFCLYGSETDEEQKLPLDAILSILEKTAAISERAQLKIEVSICSGKVCTVTSEEAEQFVARSAETARSAAAGHVTCTVELQGCTRTDISAWLAVLNGLGSSQTGTLIVTQKCNTTQTRLKTVKLDLSVNFHVSEGAQNENE